MELRDMTRQELEAFAAAQQKEYDRIDALGLEINMARGKPCPKQLDASEALFKDVYSVASYIDDDGLDTRNYGGLYGIEAARAFFGELLDMPSKNVIVGGSASLQLMYDFLAQCCLSGIGGCVPWSQQPGAKFLCVVPGYDRHFAITEYLGLEMVNVPILEDGPDMDLVEELVKDARVKGMFCVPKYSNPDGITYSDAVVQRLARLEPAAKDFRVIWDNAYLVHDLYDEGDKLLNIFTEAAKYGHEDYFVEFASTSKITFAGAGISCVCASDANIAAIGKRMYYQIISFDKMNQLRHVRAIPDMAALKAHMRRHADILRPKFDAVLEVLESELSGLGIARWHKPMGGYFIGLKVDVGSAKYAGVLCKDAGLTLTNVGAAFPYGFDPEDCEIRIAPSYPSEDDLRLATHLLCTAVKLAAARELLK